MRFFTLFTLGLLLAGWGVQRACAFATEAKGNQPLSAKNYEAWKGIMPLVNDKARVYEVWANGNERLFYKGTTKELNAALAHFVKVEVKNHVVVLRPGPAGILTFDQTEIPCNWELHVLGGLARNHANDDIEDLECQRDPVLTVYVGGDIDLAKIEIPKGVTLRAAPGKTEEARANAAIEQGITAFLKARKSEGRE